MTDEQFKAAECKMFWDIVGTMKSAPDVQPFLAELQGMALNTTQANLRRRVCAVLAKYTAPCCESSG